MKNYHRIVQDGIKLFGENNRKDILKISSRKLCIYHSTNRKIKPIEYQPDVTFTVTDRRKYTFQVLSSQLKNKRQIEADIFRAFLSPEVSKLILIVPSKEDMNMVNGISRIIEDTLLDYGINERTLPITIFIVIPDDVKTAEDVVGYLKVTDKESKLFLTTDSKNQ